MTYTHFTLLSLAFLGIILNNLVALNKINHSMKGNLKIKDYLKLEVFGILTAVVLSVVAVIISQEIKQLEQAGKWLGLAFMAIGYMGQSLLLFVMGKANKAIGKDEETKTDDANV